MRAACQRPNGCRLCSSLVGRQCNAPLPQPVFARARALCARARSVTLERATPARCAPPRLPLPTGNDYRARTISSSLIFRLLTYACARACQRFISCVSSIRWHQLVCEQNIAVVASLDKGYICSAQRDDVYCERSVRTGVTVLTTDTTIMRACSSPARGSYRLCTCWRGTAIHCLFCPCA